jgi:preprotein translocase subunit YajC
MWVTQAFAQDAAAPAATTGGGSAMLLQLLPFVLIFVIMYFLILRPQQKRVRTHQDMIKNLRRGDTVVTAGGIIGRITKVTEESDVQVEIAEGVRVRVARGMITDVRAKGEPVKEDAA